MNKTGNDIPAKLRGWMTGANGGLALALAVVLGLAAQLYFVSLDHLLGLPVMDMGGWWVAHLSDGSLFPGLVLYLLAGFYFVRALQRQADVPNTLIFDTQSPARHSPRLGFWLTSLGLSAAVGVYAAIASEDDPAAYGFTALWLLAIGLFVYSSLNLSGWRPPHGAQIKSWLVGHRFEILVLVAILIAGFLIRVLDLELLPYAFLNDEGQIGSGAVCLLQHACTNLFSLGWAEESMAAFLPAAIGVGLFGHTAAGVRIASAAIGTLAILMVYLFTRETLERRMAWIPALLLASLPVEVHFSRLAVNNILDSLSAAALLWLVFRGMKTGSSPYYLAAGLLAGLCLYSYQGSLLGPALAAAVFVYVARRTPGFFSAQGRNIVIFVLAALVTALPMLGEYSTHSDMFLSRFRAEAVMENGVLQQEIHSTGENPLQLLATSFVKSSLVYVVGPAPYGFFNSPNPYFSWPAALFFIFGLIYAAWRIRHPAYLALLLWFFGPVILGSTLTGGAPTSERMLMSMPAAAILCAVGLAHSLAILSRPESRFARYAPLVLLALLLFNAALDLRFYFHDYQAGHYFEDASNEFSYETKQDILPLDGQGRLYLVVGQDPPYLDFPNFSYLSPDVQKAYLYSVTRASLGALPHDKDVLFIADPPHLAELRLISAWIPGGLEHDVRRRYQPDQPLYYSYKLTRQQLQAFQP